MGEVVLTKRTYHFLLGVCNQNTVGDNGKR